MRFRLRTLLIAGAIGPPLLAGGWLCVAWLAKDDFFGPLLYTAGKVDLQTVALGLQRFNGIYYREPGLIQAGTLMTLVIPVIAFLLTQRFFTRGIVITGVEK